MVWTSKEIRLVSGLLRNYKCHHCKYGEVALIRLLFYQRWSNYQRGRIVNLALKNTFVYENLILYSNMCVITADNHKTLLLIYLSLGINTILLCGAGRITVSSDHHGPDYCDHTAHFVTNS